MASIDEKISAVAEQVLKRPLTEDEQLEMYKIADAMGMKDVQSFLHQLLVFKMQDDMLGKRFENLHTFEDRLNEKIQEDKRLFWLCHTCGNFFDDVDYAPAIRSKKARKS